MSEDLDDTNLEYFPLVFETDDDQYQLNASIENSAENLVHEAITDTSPAGGDDESDWFNVADLTLENGPNDLPRPSPKGGQRRAEEDWFVISDTYTSFGTSFDGGHHTPDSSILDMAILSTRNGNSHRFMTTLSDLSSILAEMGVDGPKHLVGGNLDRVGTVIGKGAQFTVFVDGIHEDFVLKRVNHYNAPAGLSKSQQTFAYFRTLELEILALCHPPLREHRNIVNLIYWGYDHQTPELLLPVLFMERALTSLSNFLQGDNMASVSGHREINIRHHMCLDIADGLEALHNEGIAHGDVKPDNVLVFRQDNPRVPYLGKLSDFGVCISMESRASLSFASYRGTPGWAPPEAGVYDKDIHGDFSPELLFRCDGFSYGLVVLSILLTHGRLPFQFEQFEGQEDEESPYEKAMGLIWGHEDRKFPKSLRSKLLSLCRATLEMKPQDRVDISYKLLADDSKGYNDWITTRETTTKQNRKRTHITGRKTNETNKGVLYWIGFQRLALKQLEEDYQDTKRDIGPRFPGETLFGMAIASMSSISERSFGFERVIEYMSEAAKGSCIPAQAIIKRLYEAQGLSISAIADEQLLETWLFNSVSTGSFVAAEDLAELNTALLLKAQVAFRKVGGYNAEASHQTAHRFSSLDINMARLTCEGGVESLQDLNGNKVLHFAAMFDKPAVIKYLVEERRAAVNSQNDRGETPLHKACLAGHHAAVEMLISLGADASIVSTQYQLSPLHWLFTFEEQYIDKIAQLLVSKGKADVGAIVACEKVGAIEMHPPFIHFPFHWPFGTPLHWAASTRCTTAIDSLLKLGADINARDSKIDPLAQTALAMAARRGDSKIVQYLLNKGASATAVSCKGHNALHAMALDYIDCNRFYRFWGGFDAWIYNGPYENHLAKVRECILALLRAGCDLDRRRPSWGGKLVHTPFLDASIAENCVVALALLEAGANVNCEDSSHQLPVHLWAGVEDKSLAYPQGFMPVFQQLVDRMEDINIKAGFLEETILHYVVRASKTLKISVFEERIRFLVTHDPPADINIPNKKWGTPLQLAISHRHPGQAVERSEILLQYGARVHYGAEVDRDFLFDLTFNPILTDAETTYLLKQLLEGYSDAEKLQMATSSVTRVWGQEYTALSAAIKLGKFECVKYLLELGVDPNTIGDGRITPLDWALTSGEQIRRSYLETLADYFTRDERDGASERGVAFGLRFRDDDTIYGDDGMNRGTYFGITKIIAHLVSMGAKQARHLVKDGYRISNLNQWDDDFIQYTDGWFTVDTQPFYEHWKLSYKLRRS